MESAWSPISLQDWFTDILVLRSKGQEFSAHLLSDIPPEIIFVAAQAGRPVDVPVKHLEDGWVIDYGLQNCDGEIAKGQFHFRLRSSKKRPENVFAAVRYKNYWYYMDQADITSKRALSLIIVLFRLQAPTPSGAAPILTLPTG